MSASPSHKYNPTAAETESGEYCPEPHEILESKPVEIEDGAAVSETTFKCVTHGDTWMERTSIND